MKIIKKIIWFFCIRKLIKMRIKIAMDEREHFKSCLKREDNSAFDEEYLNSRIKMKNEVLNVLRSLL